MRVWVWVHERRVELKKRTKCVKLCTTTNKAKIFASLKQNKIKSTTTTVVIKSIKTGMGVIKGLRIKNSLNF